MTEKLNADLKKYEEEIIAVNKKLAEFDEQRKHLEEQRQGLITHGRRIEGIVAYIRATLNPEEKKKDEKKKENNDEKEPSGEKVDANPVQKKTDSKPPEDGAKK